MKEQREIREKNGGMFIQGNIERGFTTIENYVLKLPYLSPNPRTILYVFYMYQNCQETFVSYKTIMMYTGINSHVTLTKWLRFLEWIDFIKVYRYKTIKNDKYNVYKIKHNRIKDFSRYLKEVNLSFKEIENYWNKYAKTPDEQKKLIKNKESFINAIKEML